MQVLCSRIALFLAGRGWANAAGTEECPKAPAEDMATCWIAHSIVEEWLHCFIPGNKKFLQLTQCLSLNWNWELRLYFFSFYWGQRQTIQIKNKISSCGKSQRKTAQGQVKDCICFQVLLHDSDVWAKNITILWCLFPSRCECRLPISIWMPRNVSKLLGFYNIYPAKDKPTFWQPPLNIFRAFCLYICKRPSLSQKIRSDRTEVPHLCLGTVNREMPSRAVEHKLFVESSKPLLRSCCEMAFLFSCSL